MIQEPAVTKVSDEQNIRIVTVNKKKFVIGLKWRGLESQRHYKKQARAIGKKEGLDIVAYRFGVGIQAGFAPKRSAKLKGLYSLAVSTIGLIDGGWIGAFLIPNTDESADKEYFIIAKLPDGKILPWTDVALSAQEAEEKIPDLKQIMLSSDTNGDVKVYGDMSISFVTDALTLEEVLKPSLLRRDFRLRRLTFGMTNKQIAVYLVALIAFLSAMYFAKLLIDKKAQDDIEAQRLALQQQAELNKKARYETALKNLVHPWVSQASVKEFIKECDLQLRNIDLSMAGWLPSSYQCTGMSLNMAYKRIDGTGASVDEFKKKVHEKYGNDVVIDFDAKDFKVATFSLPFHLEGNGDDPVAGIGSQITRLVSLFQGLNITINLKSVELTEEEKKEKSKDADLNLPAQDWQETAFKYEASTPARMIFIEREYLGVRLKSLTYVPNYESGEMTYSVEGSIYGK